MGLIRGGFVFVLGVLLFVSFLAMNTFATFSSSLSYDNVRGGIYSIVQNSDNVLPQELIGQFNVTNAGNNEFNRAKLVCQQNTGFMYSFQYEGYSLNISCSEVLQGQESFINKTIDTVVQDIYYKEYDCGFFRCFSKTGLPFFLISEKAHDYWKSKFYFSLIMSLILIVLIFLFTEQRMNTPIIAGILLVLSVFPLLKIGDLIYALAGKFAPLVNLFLSSTKSVFLLSLILGILLVVSGISLRIWNPGGIKEKLSRNEVKEIVKEEIVKEKQEKKKKKK